MIEDYSFNIEIYSNDGGEEWTILMDGNPVCYYMPLPKALKYLKERIQMVGD